MSKQRRWNDEHGPDELYDKFKVSRRRTGQELGTDGEFIFVLRPESDYAAWAALHAYASEVEERSPNLAAQIRLRLHQIWKSNE